MTDAAYKAMRELKGYRQITKRISEMRERVAALMALATRATPSLEAERISGTGERSRVEQAMITKVDLERQLREMIAEQDEKRYRIQSAVAAVQDPRERRLLELRYIDGRSWHSVMTRLEISETWSRVLHERALAHFAEIFFDSAV